MKKTSTLAVTTITILLSVSTWADTGTDENNPAAKSMMSEENNRSMMESQTTNKATTTQDRQGHHRQQGEMPMMGGKGHGMMVMDHAQQRDVSAMTAGKGGMMLDPEMKQSMANIEALLEKLVEMQNP